MRSGCQRNRKRNGMKLLLRNERSAPYPLILRASLDPSSFPARYQQNNNLIRELVAVEK